MPEINRPNNPEISVPLPLVSAEGCQPTPLVVDTQAEILQVLQGDQNPFFQQIPGQPGDLETNDRPPLLVPVDRQSFDEVVESFDPKADCPDVEPNLENLEPSISSDLAGEEELNFEAPGTWLPETHQILTCHEDPAHLQAGERPQAMEIRTLPAFFTPQEGQRFNDALEALDPQFEEEEPFDLILGPEWSTLDDPSDDPDGHYEVEPVADESAEAPSVMAAVEGNPTTYQDEATVAFKAAMMTRNLIPPTTLQSDGTVHRCDVAGPGGEGDGTYRLSLDGIPYGGFLNWKDGRAWESWRFEFAPDELIPPEKLYALNKEAEVIRKVRKAQESEARRKAQDVALAIWRRSTPCTSHPYLDSKGIEPHGVRLVSSGFRQGQLVLPICDAQGEIHSIQTIDDDGGKYFLKGGKKKGCCFPIGQPKAMIFIAEGFATAASIHKATGEAVLVAFDCGNMRSVAEAVHQAFPKFPIVIAADDDWQTEGNPGLSKAIEAAKAVGGRVVVPEFGPELERPTKATDFNDLHQFLGLGAVQECIERGLSELDPELDSLPRILVSDRSEHEILTDVFNLLAEQRRVFVRGDQLVHVSVPHPGASGHESACPGILPATPAWMRLELSRVAAFYRENKDGVLTRALVPEWASKLALEMVDFQGLQKLHTLVETPVLLKDGSIHSTQGFDPSTGIYYVPLGDAPVLSESPTLDDARKAALELFDLVSDFPFSSEESKGAWLALLLTIAARFAIGGAVPFWLIDANGQSAGKGLLTHITHLITMGRDPVAMVGSRDQEEFRKNLLCTLMEGRRMAWLDEAESPFGGRQWNGLITAPNFKDRILGVSKTWFGPHFTTWVVTGNNVELASDTPRRCVHVRIEPSEERPEERGGFKIPNILAHTRQHRAELFNHVLTILRAYHLAGRPNHDLKPWGSFEAWSNLVREAVYWCTGIDCDTRRELSATADPVRERAAVILDQLGMLFPGERAFLASEVLAAYEEKEISGRWRHPELREALDTISTNPKGLNARSLGNLLRSRRDRNYNGKILKGTAGGKNGMVYRVVRADGFKDDPPSSPQPQRSSSSVSGTSSLQGHGEFDLPAYMNHRQDAVVHQLLPPTGPMPDLPGLRGWSGLGGSEGGDLPSLLARNPMTSPMPSPASTPGGNGGSGGPVLPASEDQLI